MRKIGVVFLTVLWLVVVGGDSLAAAKNPDISDILKGTAAYCDRLQQKVFHFICEEKVVERIDKYIIRIHNKSGLRNFLESRGGGDKYMYLDSRRDQGVRQTIREFYRGRKSKIKFDFLYEYQIIKGENQIQERRQLRALNGKDPSSQEARRQAIVYSYQNALSPIYMFSREKQSMYDYRILGQDKVLGRRAYEIEVRLSGSPQGEDVRVIGWVDAEDFSVLKFKVYPAAFGGYRHLIRTDMHDFSGIEVSDVHYFGVERWDIRLPSKTEIILSYNQDPKKKYIGKKRIPYGYRMATRIGTNFYYRGYRFFEVEVADPQFIDLDQ
jgi:hypothetical protein